mgnify:CR=1 FL=1
MTLFRWGCAGLGRHSLIGYPTVRCECIRWHKTGDRCWRVYLYVGWKSGAMQIGTSFKTLDEAKKAAELNLIQLRLAGKI